MFPSSVHHKGPISQGMVLNLRDIAQAPQITIDEPQVASLRLISSMVSGALGKPQCLGA